MKRKLVLIGAGSSMFTQGLVSDLISNNRDIEWELALVDTNPEALDCMLKLCRKMICAKKSSMRISGSVERKEMLQNADYVVSTIGVGGRRAWEKDVLIPRKYGVFQPVGDSVMPGGISRALRMIPATIDITHDIKNICPNAYFFNYSNPMTMICDAVSQAGDLRVTGLCHGVNNTLNGLAAFINRRPEEVSGLAVGLNHLTFLYKFYANGQPAWDLVKKALQKYEASSPSTDMVGKLFAEMGGKEQGVAEQPFAWEVFRSLGVYPAPGDRHITEYFSDHFPGYMYYGKKFGIDAYSFEEVIEFGDLIYKKAMDEAQSPDPLPETYFNKLVGEHEQLLDIIYSIEFDQRKVFSVNMPNNGAIKILPQDAVLEMPACATAAGFKPLLIDDFPDVCANLLLKHIGICKLAVKGALTGNKDYIVEAILQGGYIHEKTKVVKMVDEMIMAQAEYLPQF